MASNPITIEVIRTVTDTQPRYVAGQWPPAEDGHQHAKRPPTPGELEQAGHRALMRIMTESDHS